jgi:SPP1 family predicted phage head-tail adaptor
MKLFDPGQLRHKVEIDSLVTTEDSSGEIVQSWVPLASVWAAVVPLSGRELVEAQSMQSSVSVRLVIRYRPDIQASQRVTFRGQPYNIHAVIPDPNSGIEWLTLACVVGNSPG